jgi:hypothetical protein
MSDEQALAGLAVPIDMPRKWLKDRFGDRTAFI